MSFLAIFKFDLEMTLNSSLCNFEFVQVDAYVVVTVLTKKIAKVIIAIGLKLRHMYVKICNMTELLHFW